MPTLRVIILWHQHQPFYKDLVTGEYRLPWVRLHALKDYYGMVKLLDEFPNVHQNFNLVPSLITQIQDYVGGTARDPFLDVAAKPAKDLTADERRFALQYLFQANPVNMIGRYPRYRELWERFRSSSESPQRAEKYFQPQDFTDLQVLSQIAWLDEFFLQEPEIAALIQKARNYSIDDQRFVIARESELLAKVIPAHTDAAQRGAIEISTSPFYHPILPLVCDTNQGAVPTPGLPLPQNRFRHPEDAREQLQRGLDLHEKVFGIRPKGMWPSEGSVSEEVLSIAHSLGVNWMATDEGVLGRTAGLNFARDGGGRLPNQAAENLYDIHRYEKGQTQVHLVFRDHTVSDLVGFVYSGMPPQDAANHLMHNIKEPRNQFSIEAKTPSCQLFSTAKTHGNITQNPVANFFAASTMRCSAIPASKPLPSPKQFRATRILRTSHPLSLARGSTPTSMSGSVLPKTIAPGTTSIMRASSIRRVPHAPAKPSANWLSKKFLLPKAVIGTGGTGRSTILPMIANSMSFTASTCQMSTRRWARARPITSLSQSLAARLAHHLFRKQCTYIRALPETRSGTSNGLAQRFTPPIAAPGPCTASNS